ncbi:hypothetical protein QUA07_07325 [Microcoleus sp. T3_A4]|uniref:WD40 domain-containing protein n=1 Tax=Microcoleus sp. T3_A4 TaxID=2818968 RepID=UPI002FD0D679
MVNSNPAEDIAAENERSLSTLVRTIARFQGKFSLTLVRCNYASLRSAMLEKLRDRSTIEYQELVLEPATKTLYQTILNAVQEQPPKALIIVGIESVVAVDDLLAGANRARDQFKQDFAFPLILWLTDSVLSKFSRSANDLKSWAPPPIQFTMPPDDLMNLLQQQTSQAFADVNNFKLDDCEMELLENDLLNAALDQELQASWQFIRGLVEFQKNQIDSSLEHYQQSLTFWLQNHQLERQGIVSQKIAQAYNRKAELHRAGKQDYWQEARKYLQQSLDSFEQVQRQDLAAKCISELCEVLRRLAAWEELQSLAKKSLEMHKIYGTPSQVAEDCGFLAEVALQRSEWEKACELAKSAQSVLTQAEVFQQETGLYLLLLAKAQRNLSQQSEAAKNLEAAKENTQPQDDVQLYLRILEELRTLYFEQSEYLKAFHLKLEQQEVKSKYRLQAFIGAGRLQSPQQIIDIGLESGLSKAKIVEEIQANSGRSQDIKRIIERIGTPAYKLTIVHGQSGVGKSSIIQAGLVPALQLTTFEARDVLPVLLQSYHDWARDCGQCLRSGIKKIKGESLSTPIDTPAAILEQLRLNQNRHLLTVLIFDQFEEFFFAYQDLTSRRKFYDFLAECLNDIGELKIILSLREDYLFYLLEWNRTTKLSMIDNDILNKKICYYLGNFSIADAKIVLQTLTKRSQLDLSEDLVNALVEDLAGKVGEVRPIELQIVGTQLEKRQITQLTEYQQLGNQAKLKLVEEFLAEVIADCGKENKDTAELVLYLLTDENNTRPQKTLRDLAANLRTESENLKLILEIVVKSGLVLEVPATPERYQLVHDYLVPFIRKQRGAELLELRQKLNQTKAENQILAEARQKAEQLSVESQQKARRRIGIGTAVLSISLVLAATVMGVAWQQVNKAQKLTKLEKLERSASDALKQFESGNNQIDALSSAVNTGKELKATVKEVLSPPDYPISTPQIALSQILDNIREQNRFKGHQSSLSSVSFSPDGKYIATASYDKTARLWDVRGKLIREFKGHQNAVLSVSFSPDGKYIATASSDKTARLWDVTGKLIREFKGHQDAVESVSFSPDGKYIATASYDKTARLWNVTGKLIREFKGYQSSVLSVSFSPDGKYIATASRDKTARLWDVTGKLIREFKGHQDEVESVSFSPDGKYIATASYDKTARLWDVTGKLIREFKGHQSWVNSVSFSPDGKYIATASYDKTARLWDVTGKLIREFKGHQDPVWSVSFSPDGKYIATASWDTTARLWDVTGKLIREFQGHQGGVWSVSFSPDGKYIATASLDKTARLWDVTGKLIREFKGHQSSLSSVSFSPDGKYIATASYDKTARLWDVTGKLIREFKGHQSWVNSVSFSPDGKYIATASYDDKTARLWDVTGKLIREFKGHQDPLWSVSFSPDGKYIATASYDKTARLWDLTGNLIQEFKGHQDAVSSVSFSPDGKYIATASSDKTARLWDVTGKLIREFKGHQDAVISVSFSPDGKYIATASWDKTARLWQIRSLDEMLVQGCDWLHDYLQNNAEESEKHLCDEISAQKK